MTTLFWQAILESATQALPRLFLFGAPILLIVIALAAVFDVWTPWSPDRAPIRPPLAK
jgi:hypothetical protein